MKTRTKKVVLFIPCVVWLGVSAIAIYNLVEPITGMSLFDSVKELLFAATILFVIGLGVTVSTMFVAAVTCLLKEEIFKKEEVPFMKELNQRMEW